MPFKRPESVLVVIYTADGQVLLLRRSDHPDFWQSVTGSLGWGETPEAAALREVKEETGLDAGAALQDLGVQNVFPIFPRWRHRYAPEVNENIERAYALPLPQEQPINLSPEHSEYSWFSFADAAQKVGSWTNREAIERIAAGASKGS